MGSFNYKGHLLFFLVLEKQKTLWMVFMAKKYRAFCNRCGAELSETGTPYALIDLGASIRRGVHETSWRYPRLFFCSPRCIADFLATEVEKSVSSLDSYEKMEKRMNLSREGKKP